MDRFLSPFKPRNLRVASVLVMLSLLLTGGIAMAGAAREGLGGIFERDQAPMPPGVIAGQVTDVLSGTAIANALIVVNDDHGGLTSTTSASNGTYLVSGVAPGTYQVTASKAGFIPLSSAGVSVSSGLTATVNFALSASPVVSNSGTLAGQIQSAAGPAIAGALVLVTQANSVAGAVSSNGSGAYVATGLSAGTYSATAFAFGFQPATVSGIAISSGLTTTRNLTLQPISGTVVTGTGAVAGTATNAATSAPIAGASVSAISGTLITASTASGVSGSYLLSGLNAGTYSIRAAASGFQTTTVTNVGVSPNMTATANLALQPLTAALTGTGTLEGMVVDAKTLKPVSGAIELLKTDELLPLLHLGKREHSAGQTTSGADGSFVFPNLPAGTYSLKVMANGYKAAKIDDIVVLPGETTVVNVALQLANGKGHRETGQGDIAGVVTDAVTGKPIAGAHVFFTASYGQDRDGHDQRSTETASNGSFRLAGVLAGSYELHVQTPGYKPDKVDITVQDGMTTTVNVALEPVRGKAKSDEDQDDHDKGKGKLDSEPEHGKPTVTPNTGTGKGRNSGVITPTNQKDDRGQGKNTNSRRGSAKSSDEGQDDD